MKKITFLAAAFIVGAFAANASGKFSLPLAETNIRFSFEEPITFTERGIAFFVFPNGEFDFNTEPTVGDDTYYKGNHINKTYGVPGTYAGGTRIEHDAQGRVRRIGNVFVNYDAENRIKRIGSVYMSYYRSELTQVGGLRLIYNRRGQLIEMVGDVKGYIQSASYHYQPNNYFYGPVSGNNESQYYYKTDGTKARVEKKEEVRK